MIRAKHFRLYHIFFRNYFSFILWKEFREIRISGDYRDKGLPVLLIGNHFSWWDGFFAYELNRRIFRKKIHLMMLEEQLKRHSFFRRLGAFSINPGSRSVLESLDYAAGLLRHNGNLLTLFPQGKFYSQYSTEIEFQKGWFRILKNAENPVNVIFMANLTDYFSGRKPTLSIYIEEYPDTTGFDLVLLNNKYKEFYSRSLEKQKALA